MTSLDREWERIQERAFTKWVNSHLRKRGLAINSLMTDFEDGTKLVALYEIISDENLGKIYNPPKVPFHKIANLNAVVNKVNSFVSSVGIRVQFSAEQILASDKRIILGMIWCLIHKFEIQDISEEELSAKEGLLLWVKKQLEPYKPEVKMENFHTSWQDGLAFNALIHRFRPDLIDYNNLDKSKDQENAKKNMENAFKVAEEALDIPQLLDAKDMVEVKPDEKAVMVYVAYFWKKFAAGQKQKKAGAKIAKNAQKARELEQLQSDYERRATALLQWVAEKQASMADVSEEHFGFALEPVVEKSNTFKNYKNVEKPSQFSEKLNLELLLANLRTQQKNLGLPVYTPPEELNTETINTQWSALNDAQEAYEKALKERIALMKRLEILLNRFRSRIPKINSWQENKKNALASEDVTKYETISALQARIKVHESFDDEVRSVQKSLDNCRQIGDEIVKYRHAASEEIQSALASTEANQGEVTAAGQQFSQTLAEALARLEEVISKSLEYAKKAENLSLFLEDASLALIEPVQASSVSDVETYQSALQKLSEDFSANEAVVAEITQLSADVANAGASVSTYSSHVLEDLTQRFNETKEQLGNKNGELSQEMDKQQANAELLRNFAQAAADYSSWTNSAKDEINAEQSGTLEEQLSALNKLKERIHAETDEKLQQCAEFYQKLEEADVAEQSEVSLQALQVLNDQIKTLAKKRVSTIEEELLASKASEVSEDQLKDFRDAFNHFDKDKDGYLNKVDFKAALSSIGEDKTDAEVEQVFGQYDTDGDGKISLNEFVDFMVKISKEGTGYDDILEAFKSLAGNKDTITEGQLRSSGMDPSEIEYLLQKMPKNGDAYDYVAYLNTQFDHKSRIDSPTAPPSSQNFANAPPKEEPVLLEGNTPMPKRFENKMGVYDNDVPKIFSIYIPYVTEFLVYTFFTVKYSTADTKKRFFGFLMGLITMIIVTFVVSILYNSILKAPIIFMKLSEEQAGEMDFMLTTKFTNTSTQPLLNQTQIQTLLANNSMVVGTAPRWVLRGFLNNRDYPSKNISTIFLIMDTETEQKIGMGRVWPYRPLGEGEMHVRDVLLRAINIQPNRGGKMLARFDLTSLLSVLTGRNQQISQGLGDVNSGSTNSTSTSSSSVNLNQVVKDLLTTNGVNLNEEFKVNVTTALRDLGFAFPSGIASFIDRLGVLTITTGELVDLFIANSNSSTDTSLLLDAEYSAIDAIPWNLGKYPAALGNVAILDCNYFTRAIEESLLNTGNLRFLLELLGLLDRFKEALLNFKIKEYAFQVYGMYANRFTAYTKALKDLDQEMIVFTNSMIDSLGIDYPVSITLPVVSGLSATQFISLFLDQIFVRVVVMLAILGVILIFSLLLANTEEKTYEYGMLRALGLKRFALVEVILSMSAYFAIPGIIIGLVMSFGLNIAVEYFIAWYVTLPYSYINYVLNWVAIVVPIALGIFIPLISNIIPIYNTLTRTLRDSLDIARQTINETTVTMIRLEKLGLEPWQTALSILLVVVGFIVYYVIPYSFIFSNLPLFFFILNAILLGMLIGLCMIAVVIQPFFERLVLNLILIGPERRLKTLISKNLAGHRKRSRKTFLMFTLSVAFVIFAGVVFALQSTNIVANVQVLVGGDLVIQSLTISEALPQQKLTDFMEEQKRLNAIQDYSWQSFRLNSQRFIYSGRISTLAFYPTRTVNVYSVSRNFLDVAYNRYFLYTSYDPAFSYKMLDATKVDAVDSLYKDAGRAVVPGEIAGFTPNVVFSGRKVGFTENDTLRFDPGDRYRTYVDCLISEALRDEISVTLFKPLQYRAYTNNKQTGAYSNKDFIFKARAQIYKMPGFFMSSYRIASSGTPAFITEDNYVKISQLAAASVKYTDYDNGIPKEKMVVKYKSGVTANQRADLSNALRGLLNPDFTQMNDVYDYVASTATATTVLQGFFNVVAVIAVILCFFILILSFTANVKENSWEFGVLRAIGLSVFALIRAYIYEALCLVISAFVCGTVIGITIAMTLTAQFNLFLEMPFQFDFPYVLFFLIAVLAIVVAIAGSLIPALQLRKKQIAFVLRGLE